jgi:hypothetical protein
MPVCGFTAMPPGLLPTLTVAVTRLALPLITDTQSSRWPGPNRYDGRENQCPSAPDDIHEYPFHIRQPCSRTCMLTTEETPRLPP